MMEDRDRPVGPSRTVAANGNGAAEARLDATVRRLVRLIGRQIAREELERRCAANGNRPTAKADAEDEWETRGDDLRCPLCSLFIRQSAGASIEDRLRVCRGRGHPGVIERITLTPGPKRGQIDATLHGKLARSQRWLLLL